MSWENRIITDENILVGKPVIRGTRLAFEFISDLLAQGWPESEILRNYPGLTHEDIQACLSYASRRALETPASTGENPINRVEFVVNTFQRVWV